MSKEDYVLEFYPPVESDQCEIPSKKSERKIILTKDKIKFKPIPDNNLSEYQCDC